MSVTTSGEPVIGTEVLAATGLTKHFAVRRRGWSRLDRASRVVPAVEDVDLTLYRGRVTALVGESGSGKSTVARLLAQLVSRTAGEIRLDGLPVPTRRGRSLRAYRHHVQLILQDPFASLNPVHSVRYHLARAVRLHSAGGAPDAALCNLLKDVALSPGERYLDKFPHELSGGQRQRVAVARAMAASPQVLLADEPVSMLDVSVRLGVLNLLRDLATRLRLAVLYITHDIASARYLADDVLVMYAGRLVEGGAGETLTGRPAHPYTRLLVASAPDPARPPTAGTATGRLAEPPDLATPPGGCPFHPRCPQARSRCRTEAPPRFDLHDSAGHWAACWLYAPDEPAAG
ncbi:ABC transporter ATP-binding protein [Amycolatopsis sp. NPDC059090]|uniref:ABC transporter ATP-binding protein n=1 Tax=unclassified Amycolatopsis TaxID=2618356 RepID=UPI00366ADD1E